MPPLRERREDIPLLVWDFVRQYARKLGKKIPKIEQRTMEHLQSYAWPGNIRQLQNVIETSMVVGEGDILAIDERLILPSVERIERADLPLLNMPLPRANSSMKGKESRIRSPYAWVRSMAHPALRPCSACRHPRFVLE